MATVKHIKIYNANYDATTDYLTMQHDEFTNKAILDENGEMIPRISSFWKASTAIPSPLIRSARQ